MISSDLPKTNSIYLWNNLRFNLRSANIFKLVKFKILTSDKKSSSTMLNLYQTTNFGLDQSESSCRRLILDSTKLKAVADDKTHVTHLMISFFDRVENIVEKGENAGYQHFLLFPQCFLRNFFAESLIVGLVW